MDRKHSGQLPPTRAPRESTGKRDSKSTKPDSTDSHRKSQDDGAKATLASAGLQSPRRPMIDPQSEEQLTRQRRDEDALLLAIEGAINRNDDAIVEKLHTRLKEVQQQGVALRDGLASKDSLRTEAEQMLACRKEIEKLLESVRPLKDELQAAKDYVQTLESRIGAFVAKAEVLAKRLDALQTRPET